MGTVSTARVLILIVLLAVTAFLIRGNPVSAVDSADAGKPRLQEAFERIDGWATGSERQLDDQIAEELLLDDYLFRSYSRGTEKVTVYIGYYHSAAKVGAAHDPTVCFNGQGWLIGNCKKGRYRLAGFPDISISYSSMTTERQGERDLVIYWFQANGTASSSTWRQKIAMARDRLKGEAEESAFVRITTQIDDDNPETARQRIFSFVEDFYPAFRFYMTGRFVR